MSMAVSNQPESVFQQIDRRAKAISLRLVISTLLIFGFLGGITLFSFFEKKLQMAMANTNIALFQAISLGDVYQLRKQVDSLVSGGGVAAVWVYDRHGTLLVHKQRDGAEGRLAATQKAPIISPEGVEAGSIEVLDYLPLNEFVFSLGILALLLFGGAVHLVSNLKRFGKQISQPLLEFCSQLGSVDTHQKTIRLNKSFREISLIETEFNHLLVRTRISEQKEREAEKQAAIGRIIAQLSHDMRPPLSAFERLLQLPDQACVGHEKGAIRESLNRLYSMVESLRYSDLETLITRKLQIVDFEGALAALKPKAEERSLRISLQRFSTVDQFHVDLLKFERAWLNLMNNALDFAKTSVRMEIRTDDDTLILRVIDDGPGVPTDFLPQLFQRGATHGKADGTGLGLAYVRHIMRGHGGDVSYSREQDFTVFECRLPHTVALDKENAVKDQMLGLAQNKSFMQKVVALCFESDPLSEAVHAALASRKSENFLFSREYSGADVIVTNDPDLALTALEEGKEPLEMKKGLAEADIIDRLMRRFQLV